MTTEETSTKNTCKEYLKLMGIHYHHLLQGLGSYPGLPDLVMHYNREAHNLEFKTPKGKLSPNQEAFRDKCVMDGIPYHTIRDISDLIKVLEKYGQ